MTWVIMSSCHITNDAYNLSVADALPVIWWADN